MPLICHENVKQNLCDLDDLPALPGIALQILQKVRDSKTSLHSVAEILAADPPLSTKILHFVNSPFFGLPRNVTNLPHAVSLLGENWLKYIALSFSLVNVFNWGKIQFNYSLFWRHSLAIAVTSRLITKALGRADTEDMYFLGLIHDLGILAMVQCHPGQYALVLKRTAGNSGFHYIAESEIFGTNHMEIGGSLIQAWGLPETFCLPIRNHHFPDNISKDNKDALTQTRILHLAQEISQFLHTDDKAINLAMISRLLADYNMKNLEIKPIIEEACSQIEPLLPLFNINHEHKYDYAQILEESKKEMYRLSLDMVQRIKDQQEKIDDLSVLAYQDSLTKLANYRSFMESLHRELAGSRRYSYTSVLALADLDAFKTINDKYGHMAGDYVLQEISHFFIQGIRETDIVARYGGEEFAFILRRTTLDEGFEIMERLRDQLSNLHIEYHGETIPVTMSIGLTSVSDQIAMSAKDLMRLADIAMYRSKNEGKNNTIVFESS